VSRAKPATVRFYFEPAVLMPSMRLSARCRDPTPCVLSRTLPTGERLIALGTLGIPSSNWQPSRFNPHPPSRPLVLRHLRASETPRRPTVVFVINRVRDQSGLSSDREPEGYGRERQQRCQPGSPPG
jgi:hypothetical protein